MKELHVPIFKQNKTRIQREEQKALEQESNTERRHQEQIDILKAHRKSDVCISWIKWTITTIIAVVALFVAIFT